MDLTSYCDLKEKYFFARVKTGDRINIQAYTRYDVVTNPRTGNDIGIVVFNGRNPGSYYSHNKGISWKFFKIGDGPNIRVKAFPVVESGDNRERVLSRPRGNILKVVVSS